MTLVNGIGYMATRADTMHPPLQHLPATTHGRTNAMRGIGTLKVRLSGRTSLTVTTEAMTANVNAEGAANNVLSPHKGEAAAN